MLGLFVLIVSSLVVESMRISLEGMGQEKIDLEKIGLIKKQSQFCQDSTTGRTFFEGEIVSNLNGYPCQTYKCVAGEFDYISGGCDFNSMCKQVGEIFIDGCSTKQCTSVSRNGQTRFKIDVRIPRCKDYQGVCRNQTDHYSDIKDGRLRESCRCSIFAEFAETLCD